MYMWFIFIAIIILVVWLFSKSGNLLSSGNNDDALEILKQRFARGEISKEEYEERKAILEREL